MSIIAIEWDNMDNSNEYIIYKFIESFKFTLYLFFIYLLIQIFFLWKEIDKELRTLIVTGSFMRKNCLYIFSFIVFFFFFDISNQIRLFNVLFGMLLAPVTLVLFSYEWYSKLKPCVCKLLPKELNNFNSVTPFP